MLSISLFDIHGLLPHLDDLDHLLGPDQVNPVNPLLVQQTRLLPIEVGTLLPAAPRLHLELVVRVIDVQQLRLSALDLLWVFLLLVIGHCLSLMLNIIELTVEDG